MRQRFILIFLLLLVGIPALAQQSSNNKNKYQNIVIGKFDSKEGITLPENYMTKLQEDLLTQFQSSKKFKQVAIEGEFTSNTTVPTLQVVGTITKYEEGNRAARYMIGFGAGKTKIVAHVKFIDIASGAVVFEKDVDGKVVMGLFGGDSKGATNGLAKEVVKVAKKEF
jgi:hypothetical protein